MHTFTHVHAHTYAQMHCSKLSCIHTGNLYTLRGEHESAITHFKLATRIDRSNLSAWILLGHSYIELRNPTLAIEAYTRALGEFSHNIHTLKYYYKLSLAYPLKMYSEFGLGNSIGLVNYILDAWLMCEALLYGSITWVMDEIYCWNGFC